MQVPIPTLIVLPTPVRQFYVQDFLAAARKSVLSDVLLSTLTNIDPNELAAQLTKYAPTAARQTLQGAGIRDEHAFALPIVLLARPSLIGYYRLLAGVSQKQFYTTRAGTTAFKSMELENRISVAAQSRIGDLCLALNDSLGELITGIPGGITKQDLDQLPLMMLGAQADGSWRTRIGQEATKQVYEGIKAIVTASQTAFQEIPEGTSLTLINNSGRKITAALAADPDVVIREDIGSTSILKVAIEIKGGTDSSNAHNRAGEAEKSHQKARLANASDFWTVISLARVDHAVIKGESPTTRQWFDVTEIVTMKGDAWDRFSNAVRIAMGI